MMRNTRGISLVEALVALAVMAFGMLAIVGIQSSMRLNSDLSKQRSEAVRIGQEALERWRAYSVLDTTAGRTAYADIDTPADLLVAGTNASYTLVRTVTDVPAQNHKVLQVTVSWQDRSDVAQEVVFNTVIARADPALFGAMATSPAGNPSKRPRNRHAAIPLTAKDMGGGLSAFKPPVSGGAGGTIAWVFNNTSGYITGVCTVSASLGTADLTTVDIANCSDNTLAQLLSGYVRFSTGGSQPTAADAETPLSTARNLDVYLRLTSTGHPTGVTEASCFDDAPATTVAASATTVVSYFCAIPANPTRSWSGYASIIPQPFTDDANSGWTVPVSAQLTGTTHQVCRYTPAANDSVLVANSQHPKLYRVEYGNPLNQTEPLPMPPLPNQNFLVILDGYTCPADVAADLVAGDFVNSNTLLHTPWP